MHKNMKRVDQNTVSVWHQLLNIEHDYKIYIPKLFSLPRDILFDLFIFLCGLFPKLQTNCNIIMIINKLFNQYIINVKYLHRITIIK